jgi:hypothetical protein
LQLYRRENNIDSTIRHFTTSVWVLTEKVVLSRTYRQPTDFKEIADQEKSLRLGSVAPNFQAETTNGPIDFHEYAPISY